MKRLQQNDGGKGDRESDKSKRSISFRKGRKVQGNKGKLVERQPIKNLYLGTEEREFNC